MTALKQSDIKSDVHSDVFSDLFPTKNRAVCAEHRPNVFIFFTTDYFFIFWRDSYPSRISGLLVHVKVTTEANR